MNKLFRGKKVQRTIYRDILLFNCKYLEMEMHDLRKKF